MASSLFSRHESAKRKYAKIKADPELYAKFLEKQRNYSKNLNKDRKIKRKEYYKEYQRSMKRTAIDIGNCSSCYKEKDNIKFKMCSKCRIKFRKYSKKKVKGGIEENDKNITNKDSNF